MDYHPESFSIEEIRRWRLSLADEELFGKNDDGMELRLPSALKAAAARKGAETGRSASAVMRAALALYLFGPEHVGMMVARRYGLAPSDVPTTASQSEAQ